MSNRGSCGRRDDDDDYDDDDDDDDHANRRRWGREQEERGLVGEVGPGSGRPSPPALPPPPSVRCVVAHVLLSRRIRRRQLRHIAWGFPLDERVTRVGGRRSVMHLRHGKVACDQPLRARMLERRLGSAHRELGLEIPPFRRHRADGCTERVYCIGQWKVKIEEGVCEGRSDRLSGLRQLSGEYARRGK